MDPYQPIETYNVIQPIPGLARPPGPPGGPGYGAPEIAAARSRLLQILLGGGAGALAIAQYLGLNSIPAAISYLAGKALDSAIARPEKVYEGIHNVVGEVKAVMNAPRKTCPEPDIITDANGKQVRRYFGPPPACAPVYGDIEKGGKRKRKAPVRKRMSTKKVAGKRKAPVRRKRGGEWCYNQSTNPTTGETFYGRYPCGPGESQPVVEPAQPNVQPEVPVPGVEPVQQPPYGPPMYEGEDLGPHQKTWGDTAKEYAPYLGGLAALGVGSYLLGPAYLAGLAGKAAAAAVPYGVQAVGNYLNPQAAPMSRVPMYPGEALPQGQALEDAIRASKEAFLPSVASLAPHVQQALMQYYLGSNKQVHQYAPRPQPAEPVYHYSQAAQGFPGVRWQPSVSGEGKPKRGGRKKVSLQTAREVLIKDLEAVAPRMQQSATAQIAQVGGYHTPFGGAAKSGLSIDDVISDTLSQFRNFVLGDLASNKRKVTAQSVKAAVKKLTSSTGVKLSEAKIKALTDYVHHADSPSKLTKVIQSMFGGAHKKAAAIRSKQAGGKCRKNCAQTCCTGKGKSKPKSEKQNAWVSHVKAYAKQHGLTYPEALKKASASYKK